MKWNNTDREVYFKQMGFESDFKYWKTFSHGYLIRESYRVSELVWTNRKQNRSSTMFYLCNCNCQPNLDVTGWRGSERPEVYGRASNLKVSRFGYSVSWQAPTVTSPQRMRSSPGVTVLWSGRVPVEKQQSAGDARNDGSNTTRSVTATNNMNF